MEREKVKVITNGTVTLRFTGVQVGYKDDMLSDEQTLEHFKNNFPSFLEYEADFDKVVLDSVELNHKVEPVE